MPVEELEYIEDYVDKNIKYYKGTYYLCLCGGNCECNGRCSCNTRVEFKNSVEDIEFWRDILYT